MNSKGQLQETVYIDPTAYYWQSWNKHTDHRTFAWLHYGHAIFWMVYAGVGCFFESSNAYGRFFTVIATYGLNLIFTGAALFKHNSSVEYMMRLMAFITSVITFIESLFEQYFLYNEIIRTAEDDFTILFWIYHGSLACIIALQVLMYT